MKAYIVTLGCPKNLVDTEASATILRHSGCAVTDDPEDADVLMVAACSFLDSSWQETVEEVERLAEIKAAAGDKRLVLMGCLPRHRSEDLQVSLPDVDHFLPTGAHERLKDLVATWRTGGSGERLVDGSAADRFAAFESRDIMTPRHAAYVKVAEGCNRSCTFCAIPTIRGRQRNREPASIIREVENLVSAGTREVTLLAQDIIAYRSNGTRFADLINEIGRTGIDWIRVFYLHPAGLTVDSIRPIFEHPAVCHYLEMPVQHASDRLLERMKRGYTRSDVEGLVSGIRGEFPGVVIRSEVIVGFPGESEAEFEELKAFVEEIEFDSLGIFPYSPEPGTGAIGLDDVVDAVARRSRVEELTSAQEAISFGGRARFAGERLRVLVDRVVEDDDTVFGGCRYAGRFYGQAPEIDGEVFLETDDAPVGDFVDVRITDTAMFDLKGVVEARQTTPAVEE